MKIVVKLVDGTLSIAVLLAPASAFAQATPSSGFRSEYRLTEQEKERVLADAEAKGRRPEAKLGAIDLLAPPSVQGELGFSIGTDGSRSAFGSAFYPFGGSGGAMISIDMGRFPQIHQPLVENNPNR